MRRDNSSASSFPPSSSHGEGGGAGRPSRHWPHAAPNRSECHDWATPMRAAPTTTTATTTTELSPSVGSPAPATPQQLFRSQPRVHGRSAGGGGGGGGARAEGSMSLARSGNSPDEGRRLSQREKQVSYGYVTDGYKNMIRLVEHDPLLRCGGILPLSPPDTQRGSKRTWDIQLRKWRRALHMFDYAFIDGEDDEADRASVIEQQRLQWVNIAFMAPTSPKDAENEANAGGPSKDALSNSSSSTSSTPEAQAATALAPCVSRVRLSLETLLNVRHSPLVPTKLPVEDELRVILVRDDCFESVRNVVPHTASSLTRGTDISPLEAGIKIHIAPSAAVLRQQQAQQQQHQDVLEHTRQQSVPSPAAGSEAAHWLRSPSPTGPRRAASPSQPRTIVAGGTAAAHWRASTTTGSVPVSATPDATTPCTAGRGRPSLTSPSPAWSQRRSEGGGVPSSQSPAPRWPPMAEPALASPLPMSCAPTQMGVLPPAVFAGEGSGIAPPPGAVMMMVVPTTLPDGRIVMMPTGLYTDPHAGPAPMMMMAPPPPLHQPQQQPQQQLPLSPTPLSVSAPRWRPSHSRARAEGPQTVPRFVPMLSASKEEVRLADRMADSNHTAKKAAAPHAGEQAPAQTPCGMASSSPRPHAVPSQHAQHDGDAQRALFTAADDEDEESRTVARAVQRREERSTEAGSASLIKAVAPSTTSGNTHDALGGISQDLFGQ